MKSSKQAAAPDPYATSAANQQGNVNTAIAQTALNNANEVGPYGNVNYSVTGNSTVKDAQGRNIKVPNYTRTTTLSDGEQQKYDLENQLAFKSGDIANQQLSNLETTLQSPVSYDGLPEAPTGDTDHFRQLLQERLNPQIDRDREALEVRLANQGIAPGSEAYKRATEQNERNVTDARISSELASGSLADQEIARGLGLRNQAIQEQASLRSQPINEISALMSNSQVNTPQFQGYNPGAIAGTSVGSNINTAYGQNVQAQNANQSNKNAMMGGLFGLGGSIIGGPVGGMVASKVGGGLF